MSHNLTFIHAADLHLGAPLRGVKALSEAWTQRLLTALTAAYDRVIDAAITREVDFVVFAGDIFDGGKPSYADYLHFFKGLQRLEKAGIAAYLVTGNHDPYTSWDKGMASFPSNTHLFPGDKPGYQLFKKNNEPICLVAGRGYYNQSWSSSTSIAEGVTRSHAEAALKDCCPLVEEVPFAVGILHTGLDLDPIKAPVKRSTLLDAGMDYWALGHIHKRFVFPSMENPRIVFSGCTQGRDINETGTRSVYAVTLREGKNPQIEAIPTASVVWQRLEVDVSECLTLTDIAQKALQQQFALNSESFCEEMISRVTLVGKTELHYLLDNPETREDLREHINSLYSSFFCDSLLDATKAPRDKAVLIKEGLFPATFMQVAESQRRNTGELTTYLQDAFLSVHVNCPSQCLQDIENLVQEAEEEVLDLLYQEEGRS